MPEFRKWKSINKFSDAYVLANKMGVKKLLFRLGKTIPTNVIASMTRSYVRPTMEEGFDEIQFYNMYGVKVYDSEK